MLGFGCDCGAGDGNDTAFTGVAGGLAAGNGGVGAETATGLAGVLTIAGIATGGEEIGVGITGTVAGAGGGAETTTGAAADVCFTVTAGFDADAGSAGDASYSFFGFTELEDEAGAGAGRAGAGTGVEVCDVRDFGPSVDSPPAFEPPSRSNRFFIICNTQKSADNQSISHD